MATNYVTGTEGNDSLSGGPGENLINGGAGNDDINGVEGANTIQFAIGDGVDTVSYAPPRPYQFASFLAEATRALEELSTFGGTDYTNAFFANASRLLVSELPSEVATVLRQMRYQSSSEGRVLGSVDPEAARAAFESLTAWINEPTSNVIEFGAGITPADISLQISSSTTCFGIPTQFAVAVSGQEGVIFSLGRPDVIAGSTSTPPALDITFRFADGTVMTAAEVLALAPSGFIGTQYGADGNDTLHGSVASDQIYGQAGDDRIDTGGGDDTAFGDGGNDAIQGGGGSDSLYGDGGDDVLAAGPGGGYISGGSGNDVYAVNRGDGNVTIEDWGLGSSGGEVNTLSFGAGVTPADLVAYLDPGSGNLTISIQGGNDTVSIPWLDVNNGNTPLDYQQIQQIQFVDANGNAQVYNLAQMVSDRSSDLLSATSEAPASLFPADASSYAVAVSDAVGGEYATNYAETGDMFDPGAGDPTPVNHAPVASGDTLDATGAEDATFTYALPAGTFTDGDAGDSLTLSAAMADGSALPAWLTFDPATGTFSGSPGNGDVGTLAVTVTATDGGGLSACTPVTINVTNVNDAPTVNVALGDASAAEDSSFSYVVPANTFADIDAGDGLTLSATLGDGSALPSWLRFDAASGTFSGAPENADVGTLSVKVTATDGSNASVSSSFSITVANVNDAPVVSVAVADQAAAEDAAFSFTIPAGTFADVDAGDSLTLSASLADGSALPSWLRFDAANGTFSGTPANGDVGTLSVKVTATDGSNASISTGFSIAVANVNDAPVVTMTAADATANEDSAFSYTLPGNMFSDVDASDTLTLSATLADGGALPNWLSFDAATRTFSGRPGNDDVGTLSVRVTATDAAGASAVDAFDLVVANVNDTPVVNRTLADATGTAGQAMSMTLAADAFRDIDVGDTLALSATLADGSALPSWLRFDAATRTFSGTPGAAGNMDIRVRAMDRAGAWADDSFTLTVASAPEPAPVPAPTPDDPRTLIGTSGNDTLVGGAGDDYLRGGRGRDVLLGNEGDDTLRMSRDSWWTGWARRTHNGSPEAAGTGEQVSVSGLRQSNDIFDGGSGYDTLQGSDGSDAILLDDTRSPAAQSGPRIRNIERIDAGAGDDVVDLTSRRFDYGSVTIDGGDGNDVIWSSSGDDVLLGGSGNDTLRGGAGNDYLFGGSGRDDLDGGVGVDVLQGGWSDERLRDLSGNGVIDGGAGNDTITDGWGRNLIIGGKGDDTIRLGGGADVIAFNRGDGRDLIQSGQGGDATLSLGGGIRVSDLWLRRSGNDLVLEIGRNDRITFDDWYNGKSYQPISKLQLITDGNGNTASTNDQVETFDFRGIVSAFNRAGVSRWSLSSAVAQFGSDAAALGGDLAYQYAMGGSLAGVALGAALATTGADQFGTQAQSISNPALREGLVKLA